MSERFRVDVGEGESVTALRYAAAAGTPRGPILVLAHGAGAPQSHPFMVQVATGLAERGVTVVTFDFVYTEKKKKVPDKAPRLESCWLKVLAHVRSDAGARPVFIGGKSMGGRIASMIAATPEGREGVAGLVFLGYPLHPPGKPEVPRVKHLPLVKAPMLFVQGERDAFGTPAELMPVLKKTGARVVVVPEGEHSFKVPKRAGTPDEVMKRVMDEVAAFVLAKEKKR